MDLLHHISDVRALRSSLGNLALVPTMGALHAGHVSLFQKARSLAPHVAATIFVNPTQFGPREDFSKYPRTLEADLQKCREAGVGSVFVPKVEEMYPPGSPDIAIEMPGLSDTLEGQKRPGHFKGVCQVVLKLFNVFTPTHACFGEKDYQQLRIITAMAESLNLTVEIVPCPTLREPDGLAMSSRNRYLSPAERQQALAISKALRAAELGFQQGFRQTNRLTTTMLHILLESHLLVDYVAAVDPITFKPVQEAVKPTLLAIAARVGATRLIDNVVLGAK
ncbi:MAG: pantoate--beta-alanine ligase [Tepidisphaeraceae bacterium]